KNNPRFKKAEQKDLRLAAMLLTGMVTDGKNEPPRLKYLSRNTKPTEKEARAALARVLLSVDPPRQFLGLVACLFDRSAGDRVEAGLVRRRVEFKNLSQGHHDSIRDSAIAELVERLRDSRPYKEATEEAAKRLGITARTVQRIYAARLP